MTFIIIEWKQVIHQIKAKNLMKKTTALLLQLHVPFAIYI